METRICDKCNKNGALQCSGCQNLFCFNCFRIHREDISTQLSDIIDENTQLRSMYGHREKWSEHPVFTRINVWERETIEKIKQISSEVRDELRRLITERNVRMDILLIQSSIKLQEIHQEHEYIEKGLGQMKEQLNKIKEELQTPFQIELVSNYNLTPIYLIKLDTSKNSSTMESLVSSLDSSQISKQNTLTFFQLSTAIDSQLFASLKRLHLGQVCLIDGTSDWFTELLKIESDTLVIDMHNKSLREQEDFLDQLSNLKHLHSVYIQGDYSSENMTDQLSFFTKYSFIKAIFDKEQLVIVQWAMDTINEYKKISDMYTQTGNKDQARASFTESVELYKRLLTLLNEYKHI